MDIYLPIAGQSVNALLIIVLGFLVGLLSGMFGVVALRLDILTTRNALPVTRPSGVSKVCVSKEACVAARSRARWAK